MKKLAAIILIAVCALLCLVACDKTPDISITSQQDTYTVAVGANVNYSTYFIVTNKQGQQLAVLDSMLDTSNADTSKEGTFTVTCTLGEVSKTITFVVTDNNSGSQTLTPVDLSAVFDQYDDYSKWNFQLDYTISDGSDSYVNKYGYMGDAFWTTYEDYYGDTYTDYVDYVIDSWYYFADNGNSTYTMLAEGTADFETFYNYLDYLELTTLNDVAFAASGNHYVAINPQTAGNEILGEYTGYTYQSLELYVDNGKISKIVAVHHSASDGTYTYTLDFFKYGEVSFDITDLVIDDNNGGETGGDTTTTTTTTFTDQNLNYLSGGMEFNASRSADGFDNTADNRGVQFYQSKGAVTLTSAQTVSAISSVSVLVASNNNSGMAVSVTVGGTTFTCNGDATATTGKTKGITLTFENSVAANGLVVITLTPKASSNSMYIAEITLNGNGSGSNGGSGETGGDTTNPSTNVMPNQTFDPNNHVDYDDILIDAQNKYIANSPNNNNLRATGLQSQGTYNALVIPVQFSNDPFTATELTNLNKAFNGTTTDTGWNSVKTYYQTASFGKLNITFDIQSPVEVSQTSSYYETSNDGSLEILDEVLTDLGHLDLSKYDVDKDGYADAIYLIYSASINQTDDDSIYWAFVTWDFSGHTYGTSNTKTHYYLFAGIDFMLEEIEGTEYGIDGLKINASTYIHETGHLLGLDDYYNYEQYSGCKEGLGNADMMDYTVGDHNPYSKLLMGWLKPTVVTETTTLTLTPHTASAQGNVAMILLNYNGTYFSEYLMVELYTATNLNKMHAGVEGGLLYDGEQYGVRIYHVSSAIDKPFNDKYGSFTTLNNSQSSKPLIKLVEADGDYNFESDTFSGVRYASADDLWQTGNKLSVNQPNYTRQDGKLLNFDISFDSVTDSSATITVTFKTAA